MAELFPDYQLSEEGFMEVITERIYKTRFRYEEDDTSGGRNRRGPKKRVDSKERPQFYVSLNGHDPLPVQAVSLTHEAIHIDINERIGQSIVWGTFAQIKSDQELLVQDRNTKFMEENQSLPKAGVSFLKMKHGDGLQIPLIPEPYYSATSES